MHENKQKHSKIWLNNIPGLLLGRPNWCLYGLPVVIHGKNRHQNRVLCFCDRFRLFLDSKPICIAYHIDSYVLKNKIL